MIQLMLGGVSATEVLGAGVPGFAVIETDGTIEAGDSLKSAYHGAAVTGCPCRPTRSTRHSSTP